MENKEEEILERFAAGTATEEEKVLVSDWILLGRFPELTLSEKEINVSLANIESRLPVARKARKIKLWPRIAAAASVVIAIMVGGYFYYDNQKQTKDVVAYQNDIAPGKNGASLTLANGQKILINDALTGNIATQAGVKITKSPDGQIIYTVTDEGAQNSDAFNTLQTSNGEQTQLRLPDGTVVYLNSASSLRYPASFANLKSRSVELSGEGYFEVANDKLHPFIVKTAGQQVQVLGTHFNINAYADEPAIATTLMEGSVKLSAGSEDKVLKPGEQAVNDDGKIKVGKANIEAIVDWKNEEFFLDKMDFRVAMRKIARWYNIEVIYNGSVPVNLEAGGWIPRNSKLSDVLKSIESSGLVHFKMEGKKLYVSK